MQVKNPIKLTTVLLASTVMAGSMVLPEAACGAQAQKRYQEQLRQEEEAKHKATLATLGGSAAKHKDALANPAAALTAVGLTDLTAILTAAAADVASAANGLPLATNENKIDAMKAIEGGGGGDAPHKAAIRTALGLDPNPAAANHVAITADVTAFIAAAEERLVKLPGKTAKATDRKAQVTGLTKYKADLKDPAAALAAAGLTGLTAILTAAAADGASAANGLPLATNENKIDAMKAIEGGGGGDAPHKAAIRTALGLDPNPAAPNHLAITADVTAFIAAAEERLVKLPEKTAKATDRKATIVELQKYANAIAQPHTALGGGALQAAIAHEVTVIGSAAHGKPTATPEEKAAVVRAIEISAVHHGGLGGSVLNDTAKSAIRTALGIDPNPANFVTTRAQILAFLIVAEAPEIYNMLAGLGAPGDPTLIKLDTVRTTLLAGTYNAKTGANTGGAGGIGDTIVVSLTRLGL
jgi:hypothetical protein